MEYSPFKVSNIKFIENVWFLLNSLSAGFMISPEIFCCVVCSWFAEVEYAILGVRSLANARVELDSFKRSK